MCSPSMPAAPAPAQSTPESPNNVTTAELAKQRQISAQASGLAGTIVSGGGSLGSTGSQARGATVLGSTATG